MAVIPREIRDIILDNFSEVVVRNYNTFGTKNSSDETFVEELRKFAKIPERSRQPPPRRGVSMPIPIVRCRSEYFWEEDSPREKYSPLDWDESDSEWDGIYPEEEDDSEDDSDYILTEYIPTE